MPQTHDGAMKIAAARAGVSMGTFLAQHTAGFRWCIACRAWHPAAAFGTDRSHWDGLSPTCLEARRQRQKASYVLKGRAAASGRTFVEPRSEDRRQARGRVNYLIRAGLLPPPNAVPCTDCGHQWTLGERRHEYDHYLGYGVDHHEDVQAVCTLCHRKRNRERGETIQMRQKNGQYASKGVGQDGR